MDLFWNGIRVGDLVNNQPYWEPATPPRLWERRFRHWGWRSEVLLSSTVLLAVLVGLVAGTLS